MPDAGSMANPVERGEAREPPALLAEELDLYADPLTAQQALDHLRHEIAFPSDRLRALLPVHPANTDGLGPLNGSLVVSLAPDEWRKHLLLDAGEVESCVADYYCAQGFARARVILSLECCFRICAEPRRLRQSYAYIVPKSIPLSKWRLIRRAVPAFRAVFARGLAARQRAIRCGWVC